MFRDPYSDSCAGDVWALGCTLYLLLTDRLPYSELGDPDSLDASRFERPLIPASRLNAQVDPALDSILFRALALKPDDRYPNAKELLTDLSRWRPLSAGDVAKSKGSTPSDVSKGALGEHSPQDKKRAQRMAAQAIKLSRQAGKLVEAADLMEQALNMVPDLRQDYEYQLKLWRRGVIT